jgi:anti-anti-sigma regulatory factor
MNARQLLNRLYTLLDHDDVNGIVELLRRERRHVDTDSGAVNEHGTIVRIDHSADRMIVKPAGPRINEREALVIRMSVTRALLDRSRRPREIIIDFNDVKTMNSTVLSLFAQIKHDSQICGATTRGIGVPDAIAKPIRRLGIGHARRRMGLSRLFG